MKIKFLLVLFILTGCSKREQPPIVIEPGIPEVVDVIDFVLAEVDYQLPVSYETLISDGWKPIDSVEGTLEAHKYVSDIYMRKGTNLIIVSLHNNTDQVIDKTDALVAVIAAENRTSVNGKDQPVDIQVSGFLTFASTEDEITEKLGEPAIEENEVFRTLTYQHNKLMKTEIKIQKGNGEMRWITIQNFK